MNIYNNPLYRKIREKVGEGTRTEGVHYGLVIGDEVQFEKEVSSSAKFNFWVVLVLGFGLAYMIIKSAFGA